LSDVLRNGTLRIDKGLPFVDDFVGAELCGGNLDDSIIRGVQAGRFQVNCDECVAHGRAFLVKRI